MYLFINIYYSVYTSILGILKDMSVINTVLALRVYHVAGEKNKHVKLDSLEATCKYIHYVTPHKHKESKAEMQCS